MVCSACSARVSSIRTDNILDRAAIPCAANDASATNSPPSSFKRSLNEAETAYASLETSNKRLKTEIDELQREKAQLYATGIRLEEEQKTIRQELYAERHSTWRLKQELATEKDARAAAKKQAVEAATRIEKAEKKAASKYAKELQDIMKQVKATADQAVFTKARLEQALESTRTS
jgi:chromosome segregation ATPase